MRPQPNLPFLGFAFALIPLRQTEGAKFTIVHAWVLDSIDEEGALDLSVPLPSPNSLKSVADSANGPNLC